MKKPELIIVAAGAAQRGQLVIHNRQNTDQVGTFAMELIRSGLMAGIADGETASGEIKVRLLTPTELVERACEISERAFEAIEKRGWLLDYPPYDEIEKARTDKVGFSS